MNLEAYMKECMKPHSLLHMLTGIGLGLLLVGLMPELAYSALMLGVILVVAGVVGDLLIQKKK